MFGACNKNFLHYIWKIEDDAGDRLGPVQHRATRFNNTTGHAVSALVL